MIPITSEPGRGPRCGMGIRNIPTWTIPIQTGRSIFGVHFTGDRIILNGST